MNLRSKIFKFIFGEEILRLADDYRAGKGFVCCELFTAIALTTAITAGASMYTSARAERQAEMRQRSLLSYQEQQVSKAEQKAAQAETLATEQAKEAIKKKRRSVTQTVFTSPLGTMEEANIGTRSL